VDNWSKLLNRAGEDSGGLVSSGLDSALLVGGLVEPGLHEARPVLAEVSVGELIVVLDHLA